MPSRTAHELWETALGQLELQVTRPNFETWLRSTTGLRYDSDALVVGVPSDFVLEWLRGQLAGPINKTVSQLAGDPLSVNFEVLGAQRLTPPANNGRKPAPPSSTLPFRPNARFTFDTFSVVDSNRLAYRAAQQVAAGDAAYNPLIICGSPGLGKTHLLHAIAQHAAAARKAVALMTADDFVNDFTSTVRAGQPATFRAGFNGCDLFLLDDLQTLSTKPGSRRQFFHLFESLSSTGCAFALASDTPPANLPQIPTQLLSRLEAGLTVELQPPSPAERLRIVKTLASGYPTPPSADVLRLIADSATGGHGSVRHLVGSLNRIIAYGELTGSPVPVEAAPGVLAPLRQLPGELTPSTVLDAVCRHFHISSEQIAGPSRAHDVAYARHIAMYLLRTYNQQPLTRIGQLLGGRDHTTVLYGYERVQRDLRSFPRTRADLEQLESALRELATG
ncbi:MAG: DnaA/Hda family protein [Dehalococcoidia bacterium]